MPTTEELAAIVQRELDEIALSQISAPQGRYERNVTMAEARMPEATFRALPPELQRPPLVVPAVQPIREEPREQIRADQRLGQSLAAPYSYENLLQSIARLPIGLVGDPRNPTVRATIPLKDQLSLVMEGDQRKGMGLLKGRW